MQPTDPATDLSTELASDPAVDPATTAFRRRLAVVVLVAAVWRFGVLAVDKWHQPLLLNDSIYYAGQAQQLVNGVWFREIFVDQPGAEHGPLTSTLLATVSWLPHPQGWQRAMTVLCGVITVALLGVLGRRMAQGWTLDVRLADRVGLVAAGIAAAYPNLWMNDGLVMSESVSVLTVVLALLAALRAVRTPSPRALLLLGASCGLGALARSELALLAPGFAVVIVCAHRDGWRRSVGRAAMIGAAAAALVAPWVTFNLVRFERPTTLTTNDGTTLLGSYCDASFHGPNRGGWSLLCVVNDPAYSSDEEPSVRSERQRRLALDYARSNVRDVPVVVAARIGRTLDLYGLDSLVAQDVGEERYRWASWAGIVTWWLLAPMAVLGWIRLGTGEPGGRRERWLLVVPCVGVLVTTIVFYGGHRIRSSLEPSVVIASAVWLVARLRRSPTSDESSSTVTNSAGA
jgi:4-amino-4-deoxy-L-arabinose transferase-like glycosyltransferase